MKSKFKKIPGVAVLFFCLLAFPAFSQEESDQMRVFQVIDQTFRLETVPSADGFHIVLDNGHYENLSRDFPGDNIFPYVEVAGDRFFVSWINDRQGDVSLCFFDSAEGRARVLAAGGYTFICHETRILLSGNRPQFIFFKGNQAGNDDIFCYDFSSGQVKNLTQTPENEKTFTLLRENRRVYLDIRTLYDRLRYRFQGERVLLERLSRERVLAEIKPRPIETASAATNTYLAFGDSITWGKMRMNDLPEDPTGEYHHPELAYPQKIQDMLADEYGLLDYYNRGIPGEFTLDGASRIVDELTSNPAKYFLLMEGTNDARMNQFSVDSSLENLRYIVSAALANKMNIVISTIPPRNDSMNIPRVIDNIKNLNAGIIALSGTKNIKYIDTYTTFMNYNPPDGWKTLLEDRGKEYDKTREGGQHPSPLGHIEITKLFIPQMLAYPPAPPTGISVQQPKKHFLTVDWLQNEEFDFYGYIIEYGYLPGSFPHSITTTGTSFSLMHPPFVLTFHAKLYFRIQGVDKGNNRGKFTSVISANFD